MLDIIADRRDCRGRPVSDSAPGRLQLLLVDDLQERRSGENAGIAHVLRQDDAVAPVHAGEDLEHLVGGVSRSAIGAGVTKCEMRR